MPLVNHAFARVTPAIVVVSRRLCSKAIVLLVRTQIRHFRSFRQNPPLLGGTKARFAKGTVFFGDPDFWPPRNRKMTESIASHDLLGFLKQALLAPRAVIVSSQISGS